MPSHFEAQLRAAGLTAGAAAAKAAMFARLARAWDERSAAPPAGAWFVPGRIELLGKHTDYAGGRSLLCAVERGFCLLAGPRAGGRVRLYDAGWPAEAEFAWNAKAAPPAGAPWAIYAATVTRRLTLDFPEVLSGASPGAGPGADLVFVSDLPRAAGLSSSSALVVASLLGLTAAAGVAVNLGGREAMAEYLAAVESGRAWRGQSGGAGVGTHGGSEDHTAILCCRPGHWSQFRFCPVRPESVVAAPADKQLVVAVSGVAAAKTGCAQAAYNRAARMAAAILAAWNAAAGRGDPTLGAALASEPGALERVRA
ncbi:MAG: galactokinase family protein, partial [Terriglobales bacterium]